MARALPLFALLLLPAFGLAQGKLEQVREAVDTPRPPAHDKDSSSKSDNSDDDPAFGELFFYVATSPWWLPYAAFDAGMKHDARFNAYTYAGAGYLVVDRTDAVAEVHQAPPDMTGTQWWSVRASAEAGSNFDGLDRVGLRLFLDTETRLGLKTDWDYYSEKQPCGCRDTLWIGDLTATFRFAQNERLMMTTGLGARLLLDHGHDRGGFNFLYGFDAFPVKPVHLFGSFDGGNLGHAGYARLRGGIGMNWTHVELFAGYDFVRIGGVNLQGPMAGLRLWF